MWFTAPLLVLVLFDRVGRGVAGALIGGSVMFVAGGLAWGIPLLIASGGLNAYLAALGTQAGEDFAAGEMLYLNPNPRAAAFALLRTFVHPWDSTALATAVLVLAAAGLVQLLWRDRRSLAAVIALAGPYLVFHLAVPGHVVHPLRAAAGAGGGVSRRQRRLAGLGAGGAGGGGARSRSPASRSPVRCSWRTARSRVRPSAPCAPCRPKRESSPPGALAMHQTFVRPLEAEDVGISPQLPSPPRLEWLELVKYWKSGKTEPIWFLADPMRSDLALIDPASRQDCRRVPVAARRAAGVWRHAAVGGALVSNAGARMVREEGWSLTPETSGMAGLMGRGPHLAPITAMVRRRAGRRPRADRRPQSRRTRTIRRRISRMSIDGVLFQEWDASPGFFLKMFDIPAGRLSGSGTWATVSVQSTPSAIPTAIEQFDLQDERCDDVGLRRGLAGSRIQHGPGRLAMDERSCNAAHCRSAARSCGSR